MLLFPKKIVLVFFLFTRVISLHSQEGEFLMLQKKTGERVSSRENSFHRKYSMTRSVNPLILAGNGLLWVYQRFFSEQIMAGCGFEPTCSSFARQAIKERGLLKGLLLTADRLSRCNGAAQLEAENYLLNKKTGKLYDEPRMYRMVD